MVVKKATWVASPVRYRRPQWVEPGNTPEQSDNNQVN